MAKIISSFTIASYRGIHNLTVDQLNDINLIVLGFLGLSDGA